MPNRAIAATKMQLESFARMVRRAFLPQSEWCADGAYLICVNYDISVEDAIKSGRFTLPVSQDITSEHFPTERKGVDEVPFRIERFNRVLSTEDVLQKLDDKGMRPAELIEICFFSGQHVYAREEKCLIVALGSVWQSDSGIHFVPCLVGQGREHGLGLTLASKRISGWGSFYQFAAVCK